MCQCRSNSRQKTGSERFQEEERKSVNLGHLLHKPITKICFVHIGAPWLIASSGRFEFPGCDLCMNMFSQWLVTESHALCRRPPLNSFCYGDLTVERSFIRNLLNHPKPSTRLLFLSQYMHLTFRSSIIQINTPEFNQYILISQ